MSYTYTFTCRYSVLVTIISILIVFGIMFYSKQYSTIYSSVISPPFDRKLLDETRSKIREQISWYNFSLSGADRFEDLVLETGGRPLRSIIISTWESGSNYLGQILNAVPGTYYHFEPLSFYGIERVRSHFEANESLTTIKNLLNCNYIALKDHWEYEKKLSDFYSQNKRLWKHCNSNKKLCFDVSFLSRFCKLFPFQAMSIVRLKLVLMRKILRDQEFNARAILLVRDPRGVMLSMWHKDYCRNAIECVTAQDICSDMISDHEAASRIMMNNPGQLMIVRFEELTMKPFHILYQMFKFLKITDIKTLKKFVAWMARVEYPGASSVYSLLLGDTYKWKNVLNFGEVHDIQMACKYAMLLWGYKSAHNETHLKSKHFNPIGNIFTKNWYFYVSGQRSKLKWKDYRQVKNRKGRKE